HPAAVRFPYATLFRSGGVDAIVIETCQDLLQTKAAIIGARRAMAADASDVPLIAHVTIETTGSMLLGSEIGAALTALEPLGISRSEEHTSELQSPDHL